MMPKPATSSIEAALLVVALTSSRDRLARQIAVTPVSVSTGVGFFAMVTVVSADEVPHVVGSEKTEQLVTSSLNVRTVLSAMFFPFSSLSTLNVIVGRSCAVPNGVVPCSRMRCAVSLAASGLPVASVCHHVYVSGIGKG